MAGQLWKEERSLTLDRRVSFSLWKLAPRERENWLWRDVWCYKRWKRNQVFYRICAARCIGQCIGSNRNEWMNMIRDSSSPSFSRFLHRRRYVAADCSPVQHRDHASHLRRHFSPFEACCQADYWKINGLKFKMLEKSSSLRKKKVDNSPGQFRRVTYIRAAKRRKIGQIHACNGNHMACTSWVARKKKSQSLVPSGLVWQRLKMKARGNRLTRSTNTKKKAASDG